MYPLSGKEAKGNRQELPLRESGDYPPESKIFLKLQLIAALYTHQTGLLIAKNGKKQENADWSRLTNGPSRLAGQARSRFNRMVCENIQCREVNSFGGGLGKWGKGRNVHLKTKKMSYVFNRLDEKQYYRSLYESKRTNRYD